MLLGCIGDDFTGSSDLANTLAKGGMRTVQYNGVPNTASDRSVDAGVVALKTRTISASEAVKQSLAALEWLRRQGCRQYLFKYCSTFDSTPEGNIGPVLDALGDALGAARAIVCPAFPATGRSIYQGHLFVNDRLLSESGMEKHPLTPMTDPDLRRWLARQTARGIGHVPYDVVAGGALPIRDALEAASARGSRYVVVDAIQDKDLVAIGEAAEADVLLSGGSGIALGLPANFRRAGLIGTAATHWKGIQGPAAALCGSCSTMSRRQIAEHRKSHPTRVVEVDAVVDGTANPVEYAEWAIDRQHHGLPLVFSSAEPEAVAAAQNRYGKERVATAVEDFFGELARQLSARGVRRLVTAGGETSGAVVSALNISSFEIGPEIDSGVPALKARDPDMVLALKSGNFGSAGFFEKAADVLTGGVLR
ncbi:MULTISPECIES: 3-oxo-tetronate kinase [unclassified Mesorhizobium]|uniref:3-oxo-tetronate kinase n=1 Tax=unclassified Mesorhizobium TaxID=325217 RepID=UPI001129C22B|nr:MULTISPECIES: 3-oxo-tetronate kinase [unclassified Mesorhizobium]TPI52049.1 four-carbon acid sugar kinase family protein [Mesorhizobium sp. B3-1-1]TPJ64064.1 four-carbon acid sugar kinase family protein [Mesorhizobium sp. B2-6-7]TPJ83502.1 four-carbon acid sugar kinase family protein [Mesorhizobium sp. B2-6-3]TPJ97562.1 four-carbon acid sugar kinase family protein [Mesorhizobium sp. B2-5-10]TPK07310.1 four-carbon acid sugar kinase family protein [Mesorhizobium sp. B2-5-11]